MTTRPTAPSAGEAASWQDHPAPDQQQEIAPGPVRAYRRLSADEREQIALGRAAGESIRSIAARLGRSASTICREINRHCNRDGRYLASTAHRQADHDARRPKPGKLVTCRRLRRQVTDRLSKRHSPQQIARRLAVEFPDDPEMRVSHETIYQALYVQARGGLRAELSRQLRTGRRLRRPQRRDDARTPRFVDPMVMISQRPPEVADRAVPGHWEGDLILGSTASASAIGTLVERATGFVLLLHLPHDHAADTVAQAMITAMADLPQTLTRTLTWDQGAEMAQHVRIAQATGLDIYFCDPHAPWQRGTNENTNGLLRQYFPKSTDLSVHGPGILTNVADELNNRPRRRLDWATPAEALNTMLTQAS